MWGAIKSGELLPWNVWVRIHKPNCISGIWTGWSGHGAVNLNPEGSGKGFDEVRLGIRKIGYGYVKRMPSSNAYSCNCPYIQNSFLSRREYNVSGNVLLIIVSGRQVTGFLCPKVA